MSQASTDLRVRRTQKLIRDAFIALIEERSFDAITVGEIASRAMVSRTAFYRHYQDKFDLVEKLFEETAATVIRDNDLFSQDVLSSLDPESSQEPWAQIFEHAEAAVSVPEPLVKFFEHVLEYEPLYRALLGRKGSTWFVMKMRAYLAEAIDKRLQEFADALDMQLVTESPAIADGLVSALIAAQCVDTITWWLEQGKPYPPRQIAKYCYRLMCSILKDVPKWE